jgi:hypothetical protein
LNTWDENRIRGDRGYYIIARIPSNMHIMRPQMFPALIEVTASLLLAVVPPVVAAVAVVPAPVAVGLAVEVIVIVWRAFQITPVQEAN